MTNAEANRLVVAIESSWPDASAMSAGERAMYARLLEDLPAEQAEQVVVAAMRGGSDRRPSARWIRRRVFSAMLPQGCTLEAEEAWSVVQGWVQRFGWAGVPPQEPALVRRVVDLFGWRTFCEARTDQAGTLRAQFRDAWKMQQERLLTDIAATGKTPTVEEILDTRRELDAPSRHGMAPMGEALIGALQQIERAVRTGEPIPKKQPALRRPHEGV